MHELFYSQVLPSLKVLCKVLLSLYTEWSNHLVFSCTVVLLQALSYLSTALPSLNILRKRSIYTCILPKNIFIFSVNFLATNLDFAINTAIMSQSMIKICIKKYFKWGAL